MRNSWFVLLYKSSFVNAAPVITCFYAAIFLNDNFDFRRVSRKGFVDGIINHFVN